MRRREHVDRGAAAVEFALVVPMLVLLLLGVVDYGIYFSDSLGVRQGMREGARQGVVENFPTAPCSSADGYVASGGNAELDKLACETLAGMGVIGGQAFIRIQAAPSWSEGNDLVLCTAVDANALTGYTPLPGGGDLRAVFRMRIEQDEDAHPGRGEARNGAFDSGATSQPSGGWSPWCV